MEDSQMIKDSRSTLLERIKDVRNIIFDMDGTLVDTAKATVPTCLQCAEDFGLPKPDPNKIRELIGWSNPEFYYRMYPDFPRDLIDAYGEQVEIKEASYIETLGKDILFPGVQELLEILKSEGFYMAIASTGSQEHVDVCLNTSDIQSFFDIIECGEPEKVEMVHRIQQGGPKGDWLLVGDKDKDSTAGNKNGMITIAAKYGFGTEEEFQTFDLSIETPKELIDLLQLK